MAAAKGAGDASTGDAKKTRAIPEPVPATDWRRFFSWKWIMVPALPAVALIAVGIWYLQRDTPEKVAKLEAQAFTEQRTTEMRVPNAAYADFNQSAPATSRPVLFASKSEPGRR